jgi:two-component system, NtrC family, nitrogen regulation sensor histidine kinase NtrY
MMVTADGRLRVSWNRWLLPLVGGAAIALALLARFPAVPNIVRPDAVGTIEVVRSLASDDLRRLTAQVLARLESAAAGALQAPPDAPAAFAAISDLRGEDPEWGVILYEGERPHAWSGRQRVPVDAVTEPVSVLTTPLYTVLAVTRSSGTRRAIATAVIDAVPPADDIAQSAGSRVARRHAIAGFMFSTARTPGAEPVLVAADGAPLLLAEPVPLSLAEMRLVAMERWRARAAIACAMALVVFLVLAVRDGGRVSRFAALAVVMVALAIIPFNAFSRATPLFDPAYYFTTIGGPWTANGGVFLLTSLVVTLGMIGLVRGRPVVRSAATAAAISLVVAVAGFYAVRALALGIGQPARGAPVLLWLSWQVPLFLVALSFALPIGWVIDTGVRRRRRLTRRTFLVASIGASVIAASLVWLTTVAQRITLAEAEMVALHHGEDEYLDALLARLTEDLQRAPPAQSRVDLLRDYAESDLAIAGYTFALGRWSPAGEFLEGLDLTFGVDDRVLAERAVQDALAVGETTFARVPGPVGMAWVAAVPHAAGATSVVALPRSRIAPPSPHAALLGLPGPPAEDPSYTITIAEGMAPPFEEELYWRRIGRELHADAPLLTAAGLTRAHIEIDLRSPEALGQRLFLVILLNVAAAGLLLLLVRASERGFGRRTRVRFRHWTGSFRSRLTLALFAFFVIPAAAFTIWGYGRLAAEHRQLRRLVVRETLHAASAARDAEPLTGIAARLGTPLFEYEDGLLAATSDTLIDVLSPLGRALPPAVHLHLVLSGELSANWEERVGAERVLVGYRSLVAPPAQHVLAAPARGGDQLTARRARDVGVLLLFATAVGALAALWLSGIAAHQFGRPISTLRRAARAVARGDRRPPALPRAPSEFEPVFTAFRRMSADLERSRVELARAERVLAWGEMARQVAHEIKNPLTPIRLGVQYLQRARRDKRVDFDAVFEENTERILREIERLDEIARAFSRYGSAPTELPPPEPVDVSFVLRDLIAFERMGGGGVNWTLAGADGACWGTARREELREVLMNVFENARAARATRVSVTLSCSAEESPDALVTIVVRDDGTGIPRDVLPRIFEPHFSTRTTGSGLGLAISRRLLDAWGGSIAIEGDPGQGTAVTITLQRPARTGS